MSSTTDEPQPQTRPTTRTRSSTQGSSSQKRFASAIATLTTPMNEEEPFENFQTTSPPTSPSLRGPKDPNIRDPDRSNPYRERNERPMDTIRRFEALARGEEYVPGYGGGQQGWERPKNVRSPYDVEEIFANSGRQRTTSSGSIPQAQQYNNYEYSGAGPSEQSYAPRAQYIPNSPPQSPPQTAGSPADPVQPRNTSYAIQQPKKVEEAKKKGFMKRLSFKK
ncbi:hypothetical protein SAICODRAFT_21049 [Saitoella complicata NRRL Y-17804]|nr:uncharacterized protein SAICODRAFT_21049 [Saitoella complicata NRRL Y-17804]ODQ51014.1 hypothetical protein SAICODRAFT_21049 [Saitoella complicata NRRL Y-17804]